MKCLNRYTEKMFKQIYWNNSEVRLNHCYLEQCFHFKISAESDSSCSHTTESLFKKLYFGSFSLPLNQTKTSPTFPLQRFSCGSFLPIQGPFISPTDQMIAAAASLHHTR
jgi:hypothetical protein